MSDNRSSDIPTHVDDDLNCVWSSTVYTQYCADSTEWCPHEGKEELCLVGNYELLGSDMGKVGLVYLTGLNPAVEQDRNIETVKLALESVVNYAKSDTTPEEALSTPLPISASRANHASLLLHDRIASPAVLDIKWNPVLNEECVEVPTASLTGSSFATAYEDGTVRLYSLDNSNNVPTIKERASSQISHNNALCLSLDWSSRRFNLPALPANPDEVDDEDDDYDDFDEDDIPRTNPKTKIVSSLSDGSVTVLDVNLESDQDFLTIRHHWAAHSMEAWIAAFDCWSPTTVYSGSDDTLLKQWDLRLVPIVALDEHDDCFVPSKGVPPVFVSKEHKGGVCSIAPHPYIPHILATGSYDEHLRIWDKRNMKTPLTAMNLEGGVWRLKWHPDPQRANSLLVTNMYNGLQVIDLSSPTILQNFPSIFEKTPQLSQVQKDDLLNEYLGLPEKYPAYEEATITVDAKYNRHGPKSIAYGGDWCYLSDYSAYYPNPNSTPHTLIQSASFYNKRVDLWYPSK